jgi:hypothetical protein
MCLSLAKHAAIDLWDQRLILQADLVIPGNAENVQGPDDRRDTALKVEVA